MRLLARGLARAPALGQAAVLETEAHGTLRLMVTFGRQEVQQDRDGSKVPMLDATPTLIMEEASGPGTDSGDLVLVDGRLYAIRRALSTGRGRLRCDLEDGQASRAAWEDSGGQARRGRLYLAGASDPSGQLAAAVGAAVAAVTQDPGLSGIPAGTELAADDDGATFEVLGTSPWAAGWTRLALRRVD